MIYLKLTITNPAALKRRLWPGDDLEGQKLQSEFIRAFTSAPGFFMRHILDTETHTVFNSNSELLTFVKANKDLLNTLITRARAYYAVDGCGVRVSLVTEVGGQELEHPVTNLETWI